MDTKRLTSSAVIYYQYRVSKEFMLCILVDQSKKKRTFCNLIEALPQTKGIIKLRVRVVGIAESKQLIMSDGTNTTVTKVTIQAKMQKPVSSVLVTAMVQQRPNNNTKVDRSGWL